MKANALLFFNEKPDALALYEKLESEILRIVPEATIKVAKTQISFSNKRGFAFVSFLPVRKTKDRPACWLTVSFGLAYKKESPRIDVSVEPYPNRWTHHIMISSLDEIDGELMEWIREAAEFSATKR